MTQTIIALILALISFFTLGLTDVLGRERDRHSRPPIIIIMPEVYFNHDPIRMKTELGINIELYRTAYLQYGERWLSNIWGVDWNRIDDFYSQLATAYGVWPDPTKITIRIVAWDSTCHDDEGWGIDQYEFRYGRYGCIDGCYDGGSTMTIHLGEDSGQGSHAWCWTALDYELGHHFLRYKGDPCWANEFSPGCPEKYIYGYQVGLCH